MNETMMKLGGYLNKKNKFGKGGNMYAPGGGLTDEMLGILYGIDPDRSSKSFGVLANEAFAKRNMNLSNKQLRELRNFTSNYAKNPEQFREMQAQYGVTKPTTDGIIARRPSIVQSPASQSNPFLIPSATVAGGNPLTTNGAGTNNVAS